MRCPTCQQTNPEGSKFCPQCGVALVLGCVRCDAELLADAKFCSQCGFAVEKSPDGRRASGEPRSYTPRHLADKILTSRGALEGERKQVTVLFADVKSSMELAEQLDPEVWHKIMERFFAILAEGVHRFEGTVNQYTGDGIMALFGAPIAHEDHAQRACYAALHIQDSLRGYADSLRLESGLNFAVRIGLNSGEVVVGKIGDDLRMDYTAQGHVVGLAARMEQIAEPGKAYLTEHTARLVGGYFDLRDLGETKLKGLSHALRVHELQSVGSLRTRFDLSRARGLSKFVGRAAEMAILDEALESTLAGNGRAIGIVAEAGQGKSRLCHELVQKCRVRGLRVYEAQATSHEKSVPLLPALQLMRSYFGITSADDEAAVRDKVAGRVVLLDPSLTESLPILFEFLGVADPAVPAPVSEPGRRQQRLFDLLQRLGRARCGREAAVFLLEDLHWIDEASALFVRNVLDGVPEGRTLLVVNYRPELDASWLDVPHYREIQLGPLRPDDVDALLTELVGSDDSLVGLAEWIVERTGGNPFYVEEIVRALLEDGALAGAPGSYTLVQPLEQATVPPTVQAILAARIDRLPEIQKETLQAAAVLGKSFSESVLQRVLNDAKQPPYAGDIVEAAIRALVDADFVHEQALYPEREYVFKHALTQEVAYGSQLTDRRRHFHAAAARALQGVSPEKLDERAAAIARHWEEAGELLAAARWYRRAASWIGARDIAGVVPYWRKVAALLRELPEDDETRRIELESCIGLFNSAFRFGMRAEEGLRLYERGLELARLCDDSQSAALIQGVRQRVQWSTGGQLAQEPIEMSAVQDPETRLSVVLDLVVVEQMTGRGTQAFARATEALRILDDHPELLGTMPGATLVGYRGLISALGGRLDEAAVDIERSLKAARASGLTEVLGWATGWRATLRMARGDLEAAIGDGRRSLEIAEQLDSAFSVGSATLGLASAYLLNENSGEALELCQRSLARLRQSGAGLGFEAYLLVYLSEAQLALGHIAAARESIDRSLMLAREQNNAMIVSRGLITKVAWVLHTQGPTARLEIQTDLDTAERLARETDTLLWLPMIDRARAHLAAAFGDVTASYGHMQKAIKAYYDMHAFASVERLSDELAEMEH